MKSIVRASQYLWRTFARYALKFGVVGGIGYAIDLIISNVLWAYGLNTGSNAFFFSTIGAKVVSTSVAILFNWIGNRYWVFRDHRRHDVWREFLEFVAVSVAGMLIALGVLWFTHHVLGLNNLVANNVSANVVGLALGTTFRFVLYRYWVYGHHRSERIKGAQDEIELAELAIFVEPESQSMADPDWNHNKS